MSEKSEKLIQEYDRVDDQINDHRIDQHYAFAIGSCGIVLAEVSVIAIIDRPLVGSLIALASLGITIGSFKEFRKNHLAIDRLIEQKDQIHTTIAEL
jgi:hypothetical protein